MSDDGAIVGTIIGFAIGAGFGGWFGYLIAMESIRNTLRTVRIIVARREPQPCATCASNECSGWCNCKCHEID